VIYLIGGPPRCGKTTLTKYLHKKLQIPWISVDTIESMVENVFINFVGDISSQEYTKNFPKNILRIKTQDSNDILFSKYSSTYIAEAFIKQAQVSAGAIKTMILNELSVGHDYIIEGHQIQPDLVKKLLKIRKDIITVFLVRTDTEEMSINFHKNHAKKDWVLQKTKEENTFLMIANMIKEYSLYIENKAREENLKVFNMDGDFESNIRKAVDYIGCN
jgi:2-phosphoglycerate kinase